MKEEYKDTIEAAASEIFLQEIATAMVNAPAKPDIESEIVDLYYLEEHLEAVHLLFTNAYNAAKEHFFNSSIEKRDIIIQNFCKAAETEEMKDLIILYLAKEHFIILNKILKKIKKVKEKEYKDNFNTFFK